MENYDLTFIASEHEKRMIKNGIVSISNLNLWDWLRNFDEDSFMFSTSPNITVILNEMKENGYDGHTGSSFAITMRNMEYIAKRGYDAWKSRYLETLPRVRIPLQ